MIRSLPDGYRAKYLHQRSMDLRPFDRMSQDGDAQTVAPKGGVTRCTILDADGTEVATGVAVCRPDENYSKKLGRTIALGRALVAMENKQ